tara:strand:- start:11507 stop:12349 length:843 start_codon:yes stop_codon:yes gene_type:complete
MKEKVIVASVVTRNCLQEFLLTKYSCELFNDCSWYVSCDKHSASILKQLGDIDVFEFDIDDTKSDHNSTEKEGRERFLNIILNKFVAIKKALERNPYCFFLDSDMLFLEEIDSNIISLIKESNIDFIATPHFTNNPEVELKHGLYNVGMFAVNDVENISSWIELTKNHEKLNLYYEQKPFELILKNFLVLNLPINHNIGWWRFNHPTTQSRLDLIKLENDKIYFGKLKAINFHFHVYKDPAGYNPGRFLVDKVFGLLRESKNEKYKKILDYHEHLSKTSL